MDLTTVGNFIRKRAAIKHWFGINILRIFWLVGLGFVCFKQKVSKLERFAQ